MEKITMPQLGESVVEGTINSWLVKEGDHVNQYDPIADVMTDKVNAEIPTFFSGVIKNILIQEGETIQVGEVICYIETDDQSTEENNSEKITGDQVVQQDRKSTRLNSSHVAISYAVFCLKKKIKKIKTNQL